MDHLATPPKGRGPRNPRPMRHFDVRQTSHKTQMAWKGEIADRIIPITNSVEDFLKNFVPGEKPKRYPSTVAFDMPKDAKKESELYEPLCEGFTKLVAGFQSSNKLVFKNHNHTRTKFPYKMYESENHITRPDVIASFPGETSIDPHPDPWRNISFVVEAKLKESEDPMKSYSDEHELTLVQLAKSARNILVSQSRLFVFVVGIYGSLARIFRFDHAGAVCSRAFNYTASDGTPSRPMYEFLWRCTHPIAKGSSFVGDDPTVRCIKASDHASIASKLRDKGIEIRDATEAAKAYRYITVCGTNKDAKRYLAYELLFMNPHLISRATTVWKAIEVDERGDPLGSPVIIKDAWRQLVRAKEIDHYEAIFTSADATEEVFGVAHFLCGDDLGAEEHVAMECGEPGGLGVGHLTVTARHAAKPARAHNERSHSRLVLGTVGVPLSQFKSTRELAEAFRDAVKGHQEAFEKGMLHRDISEGNVMISRDPDVPYKGFVQDFDYSLNWQKFLASLKLFENLTWEDWDKFVSAECIKLAKKRKEPEILQAQWQKEREEAVRRMAEAVRREAALRGAQQADGQDSDDDTQATADVDPSVPSDNEGSQEDASQLSSEEVAQSLGTEDDYCDEDSQKGASQPSSREGVSQSDGADDGNTDADNGNIDAELDEVEELVGVEVPVASPKKETTPSEEEIKRQCKLRTGTLYFKAIDLLSPGDVVHEVRHDLESFFWLFIWILLRHTVHLLGLGACERLFNQDNEEECQSAKLAFFTKPKKLTYLYNEPLTQLVRDFTRACKTNYREDDDTEPSDPLTHKKVLDIFEKALALESWPATGDHAIPYDVLEVNKPPRQRGSRPDSNLDSSRISSGSLLGVELAHDLLGRQRDIGEALPSGSRRSRRLADALAEGGSRSRKRSREASETTEAMDDAQSDEERPKRTRTNSERHEDAAQGRGKGPRVRRGRK